MLDVITYKTKEFSVIVGQLPDIIATVNCSCYFVRLLCVCVCVCVHVRERERETEREREREFVDSKNTVSKGLGSLCHSVFS